MSDLPRDFDTKVWDHQLAMDEFKVPWVGVNNNGDPIYFTDLQFFRYTDANADILGTALCNEKHFDVTGDFLNNRSCKITLTCKEDKEYKEEVECEIFYEGVGSHNTSVGLRSKTTQFKIFLNHQIYWYNSMGGHNCHVFMFTNEDGVFGISTGNERVGSYNYFMFFRGICFHDKFNWAYHNLSGKSETFLYVGQCVRTEDFMVIFGKTRAFDYENNFEFFGPLRNLSDKYMPFVRRYQILTRKPTALSETVYDIFSNVNSDHKFALELFVDLEK